MKNKSSNQAGEPETIEGLKSNLHRLSTIYDTIGDLIFDIAVEATGMYRFQMVNKAFCDRVGLEKSQITDKTLEELVPETYQLTIKEKYLEAITSKKPVKWEMPVNDPSGESYAEVTVVPVFNKDGICTNLIGSFHDVTERKFAEDLIRTSEAKWRSFVTNAPDGIVIACVDGRIEEISPKALNIFGYSNATECIGKNVIDFIDDSSHEKVRARLSDLFSGNRNGADEYLAVHKDGTRFFIEANAEIMENELNEPAGVILVVRDITRRKLMEDSLIVREAEYHRLYQMFRLMSDTMPDMMWAKDLEKKYVFANKAICENLLNAKDTSEPIGKTDLYFAERERLSRPDDPEWHTFGELCMDTDGATLKELRQMQFDEFGNVKGRFLYLDVHKAPLFNNEGELIGLVGSARDITERKQSEKTISMLAHAIRSVSECVSITDMEDRILFVNNAFLKTYQYDEQELTGKHISIVRSPKNKHDSVEVILPATLNGGWHGELINRRKDGSEFPVYLSTSVIQDESGKPVGLIGVTTDITDRKRAEQQLQESEARNKALLSAIPDLMFMFDRVGNFTDYHVRDPKLLMLNPEYFLNRNISDVLPEELAEQTKEHLSEVFETGKTSVFEYPLPIGDENNIYESRIVSCGQDRALSIVRDITDQKKMESQMIQSERLAALGEMLAGMAHEINQPLNTLSMLFDNILFEAHQEHAVKEAYLVTKSEKIVNNIQRIRNIIDHVREFAREHEQEEPEPFNINESIANALSMVSEQYKMAGIEIRTSFSDNLPMVRGNTFKFERIILNMILNSKDALLEKKDSLNEPYRMYVRINTSFKAKVVKIEVEDNGCGIREEHLHKVLQPFYTTKETGKGTGLGLSISYGLIREMNGNIDIQSKVMKGTRIIISIPYQTK